MISTLEWDSNFFGFKVGKVEGELYSNSLVGKNTYKLIYVFSEKPLVDNKLFLADVKLTFQKEVEDKSYIDILPYKKGIVSPNLLKLAIDSGIYSRYFTDPKIEAGKAEEMYRIWIEKSVNTGKVFVKVIDKREVGFISIGNKNKMATIELIAVNSDFRGNKIGINLVSCAEQYAFKNNIERIQVVTQKQNIGAIKLYESAGFKLIKEEFIYHLWN